MALSSLTKYSAGRQDSIAGRAPVGACRIAAAAWLWLFAVGSTAAVAQGMHNRGLLLGLSAMYRQRFDMQKREAVAWATARGLPVRRMLPNGATIELMRVVGGRPYYYITRNLNAADTVSADNVWPGGSAGLALNGTGVTLGIWDAGAVRTTHQEFQGRATQRDGQTTTHYHSTHVAGTMVAGGVSPNAKGMSFTAALDCFDWTNDASEMASAAAGGLLISNHSYGYQAGWQFDGLGIGDGRWVWFGDTRFSNQEDYGFGFYDDSARDWDAIAVAAPNYLIVMAGGNDRGEAPASQPTEHWIIDWVAGTISLSTAVRPADGGTTGFDCMSYTGCAKNILTVGAVGDVLGGYAGPGSVSMLSFSDWGPTDDGRIKPDICGNGWNLYSASDGNDADYATLPGTSMASPNVSGSLGLLVQHYRATHAGADMRAATLKALVLHTADECGPANGPDYMYGWGLLNVETAAGLISDDVKAPATLGEHSLLNGQTFTLEVKSAGNDPLKVTLVWTDPAGTPTVASLDPPTRMLVNDLDLRVISGSTIYQPWVLNPANPAAPAVPGDNVLDNVEQVVIPSPAAGTYTIQVSHKGALSGGFQDFSLAASVIQSGYFIAGQIKDPQFNPIQFVTLQGFPTNVETDDQGLYTAVVPSAWSGTVTPVLDCRSFTYDATGNPVPPAITYTNVQQDYMNENYTGTALTYTISGQVTNSAGGAAMSGVTMTVTGDGGAVDVTNPTDGSGNYEITVPCGWNGTVTPTLDCYTFTDASKTYTDVHADFTNQDYQGAEITYTISGTVTLRNGGAALPGVTMTVTGDAGAVAVTNPTDGSGNYEITVPCDWSGTITPTLVTYRFEQVSRTYTNVRADHLTQDYEAIRTYLLDGWINSAGVCAADGTALAGVVMNGLPGAPTTDANGYYADRVDEGWSGTVTPQLPGYRFEPPNRSYSNVASDHQACYQSIRVYGISGSILTGGGAAVQGVELQYTGGSAPWPATNASGAYSFSVDEGWTGTVTPVLDCYSFVAPSTNYTNVSANQSTSYTAILHTYTLSGQVTDSAGGAGIDGVTMHGLPGNPVTAGGGFYTATVDCGWSGTVVPTLDCYTFTDASKAYSDVHADFPSQDYGGTFQTFTLAGTIKDNHDQLLAGVAISVSGEPGWVADIGTTGADGKYQITVPCGWDGTLTPSKNEYAFTPDHRDYTDVHNGYAAQDYTGELILDHLDVAPASTQVQVGATETFTATGRTASNVEITGLSYTWTTNGTGCSVDSAGLFRAGTKTGDFTVQASASSGGSAQSGTADVEVIPGPIHHVGVVSDNAQYSVAVTGTLDFTATAYDEYNNPRPDDTFAWSITDVGTGAGIVGSGTRTERGAYTAGQTAGDFKVRATSGAVTGEADVTVEPGPLASIDVTSDTGDYSVEVTKQLDFTATGRDQYGNARSTDIFSWSHADPGTGAAIAGSGTRVEHGAYTAGQTAGDYKVQATSGRVTGEANVTVAPGPLDRIEVVSTTVYTVAVDGTLDFTGTPYDKYNNARPDDLTWSTTDAQGTVAPSGAHSVDCQYTAGQTAGDYKVKASVGGVSGEKDVTVEPGPLDHIGVVSDTGVYSVQVLGSLDFTATPYDKHGNVRAGHTFDWDTNGGGGAKVTESGASDEKGAFKAGTAAGDFEVQASADGVTGKADVTVLPGPLNRVEVVSDTGVYELVADGTLNFTATAYDEHNNARSGDNFTWSGTDSGATLTPSGTDNEKLAYQAGTVAGGYEIQAATDSTTGKADVTVKAGDPDRVVVDPATRTLGVDETLQYQATVYDKYNNVNTEVPPAWGITSTPAGGDGTIDPGTGLFNAGTVVGDYGIQATAGGKSGAGTATIEPGAVDRVEVSLATKATATLKPKEQQQFAAQAFDKHNNEITGLSFAWDVVNQGGLITTDGLFTAGTVAGQFDNTVQATAGGVDGQASVVIEPDDLDHVGVDPAAATVKIGATQQLSATGYDQYNNPIAGLPFTWATTIGGGSGVDQTGLFTAGTKAGTFVGGVTATTSSVSGTANLTIDPDDIDSVQVTPNPASVRVEKTRRLTATAYDQHGNKVDRATFTWEIVSGGGTIDADGVFSAGTVAGEYRDTAKATAGGKSGTATVNVEAGAMDRVAIDSDPVIAKAGGATQVTATAYDKHNNAIAGATFTWTARAGAGGTIDASGLFSAGTTVGRFENAVTATRGTLSSTAAIVVNPGDLARLEIDPNPVHARLTNGGGRAAAGTTVTVQARGYDAHDNELTDLAVTWDMVNGGGTIDASGVITTTDVIGAYADTVKATADGKSVTATLFVESGFTLPAGLQLATIPNDGTPLDAATFFGTARVAQWQVPANHWATYGAQPFGLGAGQGCALMLQAPTEFGVTSLAPDPFAVPLVGVPTSLFGNPHMRPLVWDVDNILHAVNGGAAQPLRTLVGDLTRPVEIAAWLWNVDAAQWDLLSDPEVLPGATNTMGVGQAGWIGVAQTGVQLVLPAPSRSASAPARKRSPGEREWVVKLEAQAGDAAATPAWLGESAKFGRSGFRMPGPPALDDSRPFVRIDLLSGSSDSRAPLAVDLRNAVGGRQEWELEVCTNAAGQDVRLAWPDLAELPRTYRLRLVDLMTGESRAMRTVTSHTFRAGQEPVTRRRFRVELYPARESGLRLSNVAVQQNSRAGGVTVSYVLSDDAEVQLVVRNAAGRVAMVSPARHATAGTGFVTWTGRAAGGGPLPRGMYLFELTARSSEGVATKAARAALIR